MDHPKWSQNHKPSHSINLQTAWQQHLPKVSFLQIYRTSSFLKCPLPPILLSSMFFFVHSLGSQTPVGQEVKVKTPILTHRKDAQVPARAPPTGPRQATQIPFCSILKKRPMPWTHFCLPHTYCVCLQKNSTLLTVNLMGCSSLLNVLKL